MPLCSFALSIEAPLKNSHVTTLHCAERFMINTLKSRVLTGSLLLPAEKHWVKPRQDGKGSCSPVWFGSEKTTRMLRRGAIEGETQRNKGFIYVLRGLRCGC